MIDPVENRLSDIPDYENTEDEAFPPLPPPVSLGQADEEGDPLANGNEGQMSEGPAVKRRVKRPQPKLDSQRLTSERGLPALRTLFDNVRFKGKGHEAEDLRLLMQKMENWAHRLYPKLQFEDFIDKLETLGSKKEVQTCLKRIRLDMPLIHEDFIRKEGEEEEGVPREGTALESSDPFEEPRFMDPTPLPLTPASLTEEQRRRIELNKQLALERRLARQQKQDGPALEVQEPSSHSAPSSTEEEASSVMRHRDDGQLHDALLGNEVPCPGDSAGMGGGDSS